MMEGNTQHRTQIYLPSSLYHQIKEMARVRNTSIAQIVRDALLRYTGSRVMTPHQEFARAKRAFLSLAGIGSGPKNLARRHDAYW